MPSRDPNRLAADSDLQELLDLLNTFASADEPTVPVNKIVHDQAQQEPEPRQPMISSREQPEPSFPVVLSPHARQDNRFAAHIIRGMAKLRDTDNTDT
jgi:hypothetical protein